MQISQVNLVLCIIILILGLISWKKKGSSTSLCIAIAFGIFGFSHLMKILGLEIELKTYLIIVRTIAYLLVILSMALVRPKQK